MRTLLLLGTGFWLFVGATMSSIAFVMAAAFMMLLGADLLLRVNHKRVKRLDHRLERWCNPLPLPETRGKAIKPRLAGVESHAIAGRGAGLGKTPGRHSAIEVQSVRTEVRRSRSSSDAKHPGQDSNLQPAD